MNSKIVILLIAFTCCVAYVSSHNVGGLQNEIEADHEVREILRQIHREFERRANAGYSRLEPIRYRKQTVAGLNYFVKAIAYAADGTRSHHHLRIYKPIKGPLELTAVQMNIHEHAPLEYFQ